jgi:hypothetical protein
MRRCLPTAERTVTRRVISAELIERATQRASPDPRNKRTVRSRSVLMLVKVLKFSWYMFGQTSDMCISANQGSVE